MAAPPSSSPPYAVSAWRGLIERTTRRWVYSRRLPAEFGGAKLRVSPGAGLRYLFRSIEKIDPVLLECARHLVSSGDVVWDIGANVGYFAFAAASKAGPNGRVFAFEPDGWLVDLLRRSSASLPDTSAPVTVLPIAVGATVEFREFGIASRSRACNALIGYGHTQVGHFVERHLVPTFSVEWLLEALPPPSIIKCDVEGAELEIFATRSPLWGRIRPVVVCEVCAESAPPLTQILRAHGYALFDAEQPLTKANVIATAAWNTIAIPNERLGRYLGP